MKGGNTSLIKTCFRYVNTYLVFSEKSMPFADTVNSVWPPFKAKVGEIKYAGG